MCLTADSTTIVVYFFYTHLHVMIIQTIVSNVVFAHFQKQ